MKNLLENLTKVKAERVRPNPYAHLSSELSDPETGKRMMRTMESMLKEKGVEVTQAPFGWYKAFKISCKGHPLSELSREIRVAPPKTEHTEQIDNVALLKQISKAKLSKDNLKDNDHHTGTEIGPVQFPPCCPRNGILAPQGPGDPERTDRFLEGRAPESRLSGE